MAYAGRECTVSEGPNLRLANFPLELMRHAPRPHTHPCYPTRLTSTASALERMTMNTARRDPGMQPTRVSVWRRSRSTHSKNERGCANRARTTRDPLRRQEGFTWTATM